MEILTLTEVENILGKHEFVHYSPFTLDYCCLHCVIVGNLLCPTHLCWKYSWQSEKQISAELSLC